MSTETALDENSNGKFDKLQVVTPIYLQNAGFYNWTAQLVDRNGIEIGYGFGSGNLNAGAQSITTNFNGFTIGAGNFNGPYRVQNLFVYGAGTGASIDNVIATQAYRASQWEGSTVITPQINQVVLANGAAQRSRFYYVQVYFNTLVQVPTSAFTMTWNKTNFRIVSTFHQVVDEKSVVTLQFSSSNLPNQSLPEGIFTLKTKASLVRTAAGEVMAADRSDQFFRLYGDINGDGKVDSTDLGVFNTAYGKRSNQAGYLHYLDWDGNGRIDLRDRVAFMARFNKKPVVTT